jgi:hypothetical protein
MRPVSSGDQDDQDVNNRGGRRGEPRDPLQYFNSLQGKGKSKSEEKKGLNPYPSSDFCSLILAFETCSLPALTRSYRRHFTFYVASPARSIQHFSFQLFPCSSAVKKAKEVTLAD